MQSWALGAPKQGPAALDALGRVDSRDLGGDWINAVSAWIEAHKYYPEQAIREGQDGDVTARIVVAADGRVTSVELERRSGSQWLDLAWLALFRDARLPPFPAGTKETETTLHWTMRYILEH